MSSIMSSVGAVAFAAAQAVHGEQITYTQGATTITITQAIRGQSDPMRMAVQEGVNLEDIVQDWLIDYDDFDNDGSPITPDRNDVITDSNGTTYRVLPAGSEEPVWRWHGNIPRIAYRIHTKQR